VFQDNEIVKYPQKHKNQEEFSKETSL